ncbi:MAG: hypothetical protein IJ408_00220 [Clostridia bacterium]|nr:hypothetical protein [Clostridia bacterium]
MYDYEKFKTAAIRHKYDVAFDEDKKRTTYFELYEKVNFLFNALCNMGTSGTAMILCDDPKTLALTSLALSKLGVMRVICDSRISQIKAKELALLHKPSVVFLKESELSRLAPALQSAGVITAVVYGKAVPLFPATFEFDKLMQKNDYMLSAEYTPSCQTQFEPTVGFTLPELEITSDTFIDLPCFSEPYALLCSRALEEGKTVTVSAEPTPRYFKKKKIKTVISENGKAKFYSDFKCAFADVKPSVRCVCGGFLDLDGIGERLSAASGALVTLSYNGAVISVTALFPADFDLTKTEEKTELLRDAALDELIRFDKKKTITVKKLK